jgi:NAD(P)-dependent dehydrogenase (short-subunit alcohol dehydrogenase family)
MQIDGSVALVTGAHRGLGKAYVDALLAAGPRKYTQELGNRPVWPTPT